MGGLLFGLPVDCRSWGKLSTGMDNFHHQERGESRRKTCFQSIIQVVSYSPEAVKQLQAMLANPRYDLDTFCMGNQTIYNASNCKIQPITTIKVVLSLVRPLYNPNDPPNHRWLIPRCSE